MDGLSYRILPFASRIVMISEAFSIKARKYVSFWMRSSCACSEPLAYPTFIQRYVLQPACHTRSTSFCPGFELFRFGYTRRIIWSRALRSVFGTGCVARTECQFWPLCLDETDRWHRQGSFGIVAA